MKYIYAIILAAIMGGTFTACNDSEEKVVKTTPDISFEQKSYKVGEKITFNISGDPDQIIFYPGEENMIYRKAELSFQTQVRSQSGVYEERTNCQADQFHVMVSSDYVAGTDSVSSVQNATWTEITDRLTLCPNECLSTTSYYQSKVADITDLFISGKPLYVAFKYINRPNTPNGNANIWRFSNYEMYSVEGAIKTPIATQTSVTWSPVFIGGDWSEIGRFETITTRVTMRGPTYNELDQELWAISTGVKFEAQSPGNGDGGIRIRLPYDKPVSEYEYAYATAGEYDVKFVIKSDNPYDTNTITKEMKIVITE